MRMVALKFGTILPFAPLEINQSSLLSSNFIGKSGHAITTDEMQMNDTL